MSVALLTGLLLSACAGEPAHEPETAAPGPASRDPQPPLPAATSRLDTPHYTIYSAADRVQTERLAEAVERLYRAYVGCFPPRSSITPHKLIVVLYKDRDEFKRHNRSRPWAEGYYQEPRCHAYLADGPNPYHWTLHEATHQLAREVSGFRLARWADEGLAAYFGASRMAGDQLRPGSIHPDAYPIWWLASCELTGDLTRDIAAGHIIPLGPLLTDTGPDINANVNRYYVHYWSLTHFLLHGGDGRYAPGFRRLVASGGTERQFRELIGPIDRVQGEWYAYLQQLVSRARSDRLSEPFGAAVPTAEPG